MPKTCPKGYVRKAYTRTDGTRAKGCILDTGLPGKTKVKVEKYLAKKAVEQKMAKKLTCPKGEIARVAYIKKGFTKKDGTRVKATKVAAVCIKDRGAPGKGPRLITILPDHKLSEFGYENIKNLSEMQRHRALNKAIAKMGHLYVIRALIARSNLTHRTNPRGSKIFKADQEWVSQQYKKMKA